jgi:basic membrane lipoprotein Med (substrate-binding protein (PBP1-ABC) superfamily)
MTQHKLLNTCKFAVYLLLVLLLTQTVLLAQDEMAPDPCGPLGTEAVAESLGADFDLSSLNAKIGFLYVGPVDDFGYNYAADQGRLCMEALFPNAEFLTAENVPENAEAERVMEQMIRSGATIVFPTSFGHLDPAIRVGQRFPDVTFFHLGGPQTTENVGTFFGEIWQMEYTSGVAAGLMTESDKLGFIVAFPIPHVLLNINAFHLGAQSVNPDVTTTVIFTSNWCDPGTQAEAANTLIEQGIDIITQHEDCPKPIIEAADRGGAWSIGYHADASTVAPESWITGARWVWGPSMAALTIEAFEGTYEPKIQRLGIADGVVDLSVFGPSVPEEVVEQVTAVKEAIISGELFPFEGPIVDQDGNVVIEEGVQPDTLTLESMNYLVDGVVGTIPN